MMKGEWLPCESQKQDGVTHSCYLEMETVALERGLVMEVRGQTQGLLAGPYSHSHIQGKEIEQEVSQNNPENRPAQFKEQLEGRAEGGSTPWVAGSWPVSSRPRLPCPLAPCPGATMQPALHGGTEVLTAGPQDLLAPWSSASNKVLS